jgi:hypothetical protein
MGEFWHPNLSEVHPVFREQPSLQVVQEFLGHSLTTEVFVWSSGELHKRPMVGKWPM